jgi:8-oxo-dGTP diphosphatase
MTQVVGAAILREGRVLAARRTSPPAAAGRWEFPGGKVEVDEDPGAALKREISEELGCEIAIERWLEGRAPIREGLELRVATARIVAGIPLPVEHDLVRWLGVAELDSVEWLPADVPFLAQVRASLLDP